MLKPSIISMKFHLYSMLKLQKAPLNFTIETYPILIYMNINKVSKKSCDFSIFFTCVAYSGSYKLFHR